MEAIVETEGRIRFPKEALVQLSLQEGDALHCHIENQTLYITPKSSLGLVCFPPVGRILCDLLRRLFPLP